MPLNVARYPASVVHDRQSHSHQYHHRFLGVGKTTLIKQLLKTKPEGETWAILVNEFGEVGIDAGLLEANNSGVQIREVAGAACAARRAYPRKWQSIN